MLWRTRRRLLRNPKLSRRANRMPRGMRPRAMPRARPSRRRLRRKIRNRACGKRGFAPLGWGEAPSQHGLKAKNEERICVKLIVGLGNPGIEYQFTPHNLGFLVIDRIAEQSKVEVRNRQCRALTAKAVIGSETVLLAKPETFMNLSGLSVRELMAEHDAKPETDLVVIQ